MSRTVERLFSLVIPFRIPQGVDLFAVDDIQQRSYAGNGAIMGESLHA